MMIKLFINGQGNGTQFFSLPVPLKTPETSCGGEALPG